MDFHLAGLTCLWISSKLEDVKPIFMRQLLKDAGHSKYSQQQVLDMELKIYKALKWKVNEITVYEAAMINLKNFLFTNLKVKLEKSEIEDLYEIVTVLCYSNALNMKLSAIDKEVMSCALIKLGL